jgi:hypothetical protein
MLPPNIGNHLPTYAAYHSSGKKVSIYLYGDRDPVTSAKNNLTQDKTVSLFFFWLCPLP